MSTGHARAWIRARRARERRQPSRPRLPRLRSCRRPASLDWLDRCAAAGDWSSRDGAVEQEELEAIERLIERAIERAIERGISHTEDSVLFFLAAGI